MDESALLNGWTRVRQWMERRDSMDGTARLNGWTETVQWMDKRLPIWHGIASFCFTADSHPIHICFTSDSHKANDAM